MERRVGEQKHMVDQSQPMRNEVQAHQAGSNLEALASCRQTCSGSKGIERKSGFKMLGETNDGSLHALCRSLPRNTSSTKEGIFDGAKASWKACCQDDV
jgi:hypothetical protein